MLGVVGRSQSQAVVVGTLVVALVVWPVVVAMVGTRPLGEAALHPPALALMVVGGKRPLVDWVSLQVKAPVGGLTQVVAG